MPRPISSSWAHSARRPIDNNQDLSKILKIAIAVLAIFGSFAFLAAEIAFIATAVVIGASSIYLLRTNNVFSTGVWRRPSTFWPTFSFWNSRPTVIHPRPFFSRPFWSSPSPAPVHAGWFGARRAPVGTGRASPVAASPTLRPTVGRASTTRREDNPRGGFYRATTRARVGERR